MVLRKDQSSGRIFPDSEINDFLFFNSSINALKWVKAIFFFLYFNFREQSFYSFFDSVHQYMSHSTESSQLHMVIYGTRTIELSGQDWVWMGCLQFLVHKILDMALGPIDLDFNDVSSHKSATFLNTFRFFDWTNPIAHKFAGYFLLNANSNFFFYPNHSEFKFRGLIWLDGVIKKEMWESNGCISQSLPKYKLFWLRINPFCFPYRFQQLFVFIKLFSLLSKLQFQLFVFFLQFFHSLAYPFAHNSLFDVLSFRLFLYFGHVPSLCQYQLTLFDHLLADLKHTQFSTSFNLKSWLSLNLHNFAEADTTPQWFALYEKNPFCCEQLIIIF